ncbi:MAG: hypothetical protein ACRC3B_01535 [Bacteroidia bacterium]
MSFIDVDMSGYPIVVAKTLNMDVSIPVMTAFFTDLDSKLAARTGSYVYISYSEGSIKSPSLDTSMEFGKQATAITKKYEGRNKANILVVNSLAQKLLVKSLSVVYRPLKDWIIVDTLEEATQRARIILSAN